MAVVTFYHEHRSIDADAGTNLRQLMLRTGVTPYSGLARLTNCRGHNFCGTCAVEIADGKGVSPRMAEEEATLVGNLAVARVTDKNFRLSCQTKVTGDVTVKTHPIRPIDRTATRQRLTFVAIATFFVVVLLGAVGFLFFDMIKVW